MKCGSSNSRVGCRKFNASIGRGTSLAKRRHETVPNTMMNVPFLNLPAQYASLEDELLPTVEKVLAGGHYILGENVAALEQAIASRSGARFGIGVNSGSDALTLALRALGIGPGDE